MLKVSKLSSNIWWTLVTAGFYERDLSAAFFNGFAILLAGKYFEHSWGSREFAKFVLVVNLTAVAATFMVRQLEEYVRSKIFHEQEQVHTSVFGLCALLAAFSVAFKQGVPEHRIAILGIFSVRVKYIPLVGNLLMLCLFCGGLIHFQLFLTFFGTFVAWLYLRFYKKLDGVKGDRSDTFSFASFFPDCLEPLFRPFASVIYAVFTFARIIPKLSTLGKPFTSDIEEGHKRLPTLYGNVNADAERRRALAVRTVDVRLQQTQLAPNADLS